MDLGKKARFTPCHHGRVNDNSLLQGKSQVELSKDQVSSKFIHWQAFHFPVQSRPISMEAFDKCTWLKTKITTQTYCQILVWSGAPAHKTYGTCQGCQAPKSGPTQSSSIPIFLHIGSQTPCNHPSIGDRAPLLHSMTQLFARLIWLSLPSSSD